MKRIGRSRPTGLLGLALACGTLGMGQAQTEIVLHHFVHATGSNPSAGVIRDSAGNLYGTTFYGGSAADAGVVYKLDAARHYTVLYTFTGGADGSNPVTGVIRDPAGNLYGTTQHGGGPHGEDDNGLVYKLDSAGRQTVLQPFLGGNGAGPWAGVIRDDAGNLYGTTHVGGSRNAGIVYRLDPAGQEAVLHTFTLGTDGSQPFAGVIRDSAGNLYGTAQLGGTPGGGLVYRIDAAGHYKVLYNFCSLAGCADGKHPEAGVIRDAAGNLYGTTSAGGTAGFGVVYKLDNTGVVSVLYSFTAKAGVGALDRAGVIRDPAGNLYGTTRVGGTANAGVVYKLDTAGTYTVLYNFTGGADGGSPLAGLTRDHKGNLYGTTAFGGKDNRGVIFKIKP